MKISSRRRVAVVVPVLAPLLALGTVVAPTQAVAATAPRSEVGTAEVAGPEAASAPAFGLVVTPADATLPAAAERRAESLLDEQVTTTRRADGSYVLRTDDVVDRDEADRAAVALAARADVVRAEPDVLLRAASSSPVVTDDPGLAQQWALWDTAAAGGGFGTRAPAAWKTSGRGDAAAVVAVVDTGRTAHPDLDAGTVAGYDLISEIDDPNVPGGVERDADPGRDADPADPGDWVTASTARYCYDDPRATFEPSSWHGTHVAGIVAARAGNGIGVAGNAPGVSVQHVRVLGQCGGLMSDVADGIRWAAGAPVSGVPINPTPARVVSLSLGGSAPCGPTMQAAVDAARARGAVVVTAAGNERRPVAASNPAGCRGVVAVTATDRSGRLASFSNRGPGAALAAPGVGILSTWNRGTTSPSTAAYATMSGTSQATPAVSAAAALLLSRRPGLSGPSVEGALRRMVQPFGRGSESGGGAGVLDLSRFFVPLTAPRVTGRPALGATLTASPGTWAWGAVTGGWYRDGRYVGRGASYRLARADVGHRVTYGETAAEGGYRSSVVHSTATTPPSRASRTSISSSRSKVRTGRRLTLRAVVSGSMGAPSGTVTFYDGSRRVGAGRVVVGRASTVVSARTLGVGRHRLHAVFSSAERGYLRSVSGDVRVTVRSRR